MAIITRFFFTRYKEVSYQTPSGQVSDEPYGSFSLDNPSQTDSGTIHFFGVMQTRHLLGDLRKLTIDTGNITILQFDQFTDPQIDNLIASGQIQTIDQRIGWVDLGRATPSFFYGDCNIFSQSSPDGKRPTVNYFYDISQLNLDGNVVSGESTGTTTQFLAGGAPVPELEIITTYDVNETIENWGPPDVKTRFTNPNSQLGYDTRHLGVDFDYYINRVINGSTWPGIASQTQSGTVLNVIPANNTNLLGATKEDHFDNQNAQRIGNSYGSVRRTITNGFRSFGQSSVGQCLQVTSVPVAPPPPTQGVGTGQEGPTTPPIDVGFDVLTNQVIYRTNPSFVDGCPSFEEMPLNFPPHDNLTTEELQNTLLHFNAYDANTDEVYQGNVDEQGMQNLRASFEMMERMQGVSDPREIALGNYTYPPGVLHVLLNHNKCSFDVFPALRDKDGDIPEPIGPILKYYMEDVRREMYNMYNIPFTNEILKNIGIDSLGYERYSDGNSYKELLGESVFGCGDQLSFDKIPEIFVELYPKNENSDVKRYRSEIEKRTRTNSLLAIFDPPELADQNYIKDMSRDLSIGVPDLDVVKFLTDPRFGEREYGNKLLFNTPIERIGETTTREYYIPRHEFNDPVGAKYIDYIPSRWKSMTRPVYDKLLSNKPTANWTDRATYNDSGITKNYTLSSDYLLTRYRDGLTPHDYDYIDEAISTRIYSDDVIQTREQQDNGSDFWKTLVNGLYNRYVDEYSVYNIKIPVPDINQLQSDIKLTTEIVEGRASTQFYIGLGFQIISILVGLLSQESTLETTSRTSLQPSRVFKQGGVRLRSNRKRYSSKLDPCPIIFLGFNDDFTLNSPLESLIKKDEYEDFYFIRNVNGTLPTQTVGIPGSLQGIQSAPIIIGSNLLSNSTEILTSDPNDTQTISEVQPEEIIFDPTNFNTNQSPSGTEESNPNDQRRPDESEPKCLSVIRRLVNIREQSTGGVFNRTNGGFDPIEFNGSPLTTRKCQLIADIEECCAEYEDSRPTTTMRRSDIGFKLIAKNVVIAESEISAWYKQCQLNGDLLPYYESFYRVSDIGMGKNGLRNLNEEFAYLSESGIKRIYWGNECGLPETAFNSFTEYRDFLYRVILPDSNMQFDEGRTDKFRYRLRYDVYNPGNVYSANSSADKTLQIFGEYKPTPNGLTETLFSDQTLVVIMSKVCGYDPCADIESDKKILPDGVDVMPVMKKRPKQYGLNPLLDVYYLNMPFYSKTNPGRVPFRRGINTNERDWPTIDIGQFPSIFPPLWNEAGKVPLLPSDLRRLGVKWDWDWGDLFWKDREPNVIIPAEDRWEMEIIEENGELISLITDKTPILDLYYSLMEMHVKGFSWKLILNYVNRIKSCVKGTPYQERIDLTQLNTVLEEILSQLEIADQIEYEGYVEKALLITGADWGVIDSSDIGSEQKITITNNALVPLDLHYLAIESIDALNVDTYLQTPEFLFTFNLNKLDKNLQYDNGVITGTIPAKSSIEIPILFRDSMRKSIEDGHLYTGNLVAVASLFDGEILIEASELSCEVSGRRLTVTNNEFGKTPIYLPEYFDFNYIDSDIETSIFVPVRNMSQTDFVQINSVTIENQTFYRIVDGEIVEIDMSESPDMNFFTLSAPSDLFNSLNPNESQTDGNSINFVISCRPMFSDKFPTVESGEKYRTSYKRDDFENSLYFNAELYVSYTHGNVGSNVTTTNTKVCGIRGRTIFIKQ